uniref:Uncharacterized protein n=1 Tax=Oryza punctata TaxID=4537 RepID=A0A0E0LLE6_ORYPU
MDSPVGTPVGFREAIHKSSQGLRRSPIPHPSGERAEAAPSLVLLLPPHPPPPPLAPIPIHPASERAGAPSFVLLLPRILGRSIRAAGDMGAGPHQQGLQWPDTHQAGVQNDVTTTVPPRDLARLNGTNIDHSCLDLADTLLLIIGFPCPTVKRGLLFYSHHLLNYITTSLPHLHQITSTVRPHHYPATPTTLPHIASISTLYTALLNIT